MSELLVLRRPRPPAVVPPLLSFTAGFIDSFTVLALFGLFVAQVTGSFVLAAAAMVSRARSRSCSRFRYSCSPPWPPPSLPSCSSVAAAPR